VRMTSALEQLKQYTVVVADTSDFALLEKYRPQDATTNPTLLLQATKLPQYQDLVNSVITQVKQQNSDAKLLAEEAFIRLSVAFGKEILKIVPGRVSTEVDARLSFDIDATVAQARKIIGYYEEAGIGRQRILIKIAATWEGLQAAKILEKEGIHVNMTLIFSLEQAIVAAEHSVTLISPFAGRITDFFKQQGKITSDLPQDDPGVQSVSKIYAYYKAHGYKTEVMGASFRTSKQVLELAGCDLLTISPQLLEELKNSHDHVPRKLSAEGFADGTEKRVLDEKEFRWHLNEDEMATVKLAEGIRKFAADIDAAKQILLKLLH